MNIHVCDQLDEFLLDELSESDDSRFRAHVGDCVDCRNAIDQQTEIDELIRQSSLQVSPQDRPGLPRRTQDRFLTAQSKTYAKTAIAVTAAALFVAACTWSWQRARPTPNNVTSLFPSPQASQPRKVTPS